MKNLNIPLVILFFLFTTTNLSLFGQSWFWAQSYGLNDHTYLHSLNADQDGSIIISGVTANNIILGQDTLEIVGDDELGFVAKVNAMGSILWAKRIYTLNTTPFVPGYTLYSHPAPDHSMVLLSHFSDSIKVGFDTLTATNGSMYLAKLDESGNHVWARNFGPEEYSIFSPQHVVDDEGNIYIAGVTRDIAFFQEEAIDPVDGGIFIAKYSSSGELQWVEQCGRPTSIAQKVDDLVIDNNGNLYLAGYTTQSEFENETIFGIDTLAIPPRRDHVFLTKIDSYGNFNWTRNGGGMTPGELGEVPTSTFANALSTDGDSIILLTGYFQDTIHFGEYQFDPLCGNNECGNLYLAAFDLTGNFKWLKQPDIVPSRSAGLEVEIDTDKNIYLLGAVGGTIGFDEHSITSSNFSDEFVAMFAPSGNCIWMHSTGAYSISGNMTIDCFNQSLIVSGSYVGSSGNLEPFGIPSTTTNTVYIGGLADNLSCMMVTTDKSSYPLESNDIKLYPNPFSDLLRVDLSLANAENWSSNIIQLTDASGKLILQKKATGNTLQINASELPSGLYFVKIFNEKKHIISTHKVIKI